MREVQTTAVLQVVPSAISLDCLSCNFFNDWCRVTMLLIYFHRFPVCDFFKSKCTQWDVTVPNKVNLVNPVKVVAIAIGSGGSSHAFVIFL